MRIEQFHYLVEIAKCHSISIAAERLHITQPTMSIAVKNFEEELGEKVFLRSKNGVFLTEVGRMILEDARVIIEREKHVRECIAQYRMQQEAGLEGNLKVAVIPAISQAVLEKMLPIFSVRHPKIKIFIIEHNPAHVVEKVRQGLSDVGFFVADRCMTQSYEHEDCVIQRLFTEKIYAVMQATAPLASKSSLTFEDLKDMPLSTTYFDNNDDLLDSNIFAEEIEMNIVLKTNNVNILKEHITRGGSVGIMINSNLSNMALSNEVVAIPLNLPFKTEMCCIYRKDNNCQGLIDAFLEMILEFS